MDYKFSRGYNNVMSLEHIPFVEFRYISAHSSYRKREQSPDHQLIPRVEQLTYLGSHENDKDGTSDVGIHTLFPCHFQYTIFLLFDGFNLK
jgi:hypothetical protein